MTTQSGEPQVMRISPSGPIVGSENNPALGSGTATPPDGSVAQGRTWLYKGTGTGFTQVPGTAAGDLSGLGSLQVDMRAGYSYDIEVDVNSFGTFGTGGNDYTVLVDGSQDAGSTWAFHLVSQIQNGSEEKFRGRARAIVTPLTSGDSPINMLRVQLQRNAIAGPDMLYVGDTSIIQVSEFSRP